MYPFDKNPKVEEHLRSSALQLNFNFVKRKENLIGE